LLALERGRPGETYVFGGQSERSNIQVVQAICKILDQVQPQSAGSHAELISFVTDRAGHDFRYAIDDRKAQNELGFERRFPSFEDGLRATIEWYRSQTDWVSATRARRFS
jgi:dTDP-glucose 4,6-dehydratase